VDCIANIEVKRVISAKTGIRGRVGIDRFVDFERRRLAISDTDLISSQSQEFDAVERKGNKIIGRCSSRKG